MTPEEREKILDVIATADGGCPECVSGLLKSLERNLPGIPWRESFGPWTPENRSERRRRADAWAGESG